MDRFQIHKEAKPSSIVHDYGTAKKEVREEAALAAFCGRAKRLHQPRFRHLTAMVDIAQYVGCTSGASVDGILLGKQGVAAVECLGFAPLDDRGDVMNLDKELRLSIGDALASELQRQRLWFSVTYSTARRVNNARYPIRKNVPNRKCRPALIEELRTLISEAPIPRHGSFVSLYFQSAERCESWNRFNNGRVYIDSARFPLCATHFERVRLQGVYAWMRPLIDSNLTCGATGLDEGWLREHLTDKMQQSIGPNRTRANGHPLWLLVHSDGDSIHRTIPQQHRKRAVEFSREVLSTGNHGFTRAYWIDRIGYKDCQWVGRIL